MMIRLFVPDTLSMGARLMLGADQTRYLATVMRRGVARFEQQCCLERGPGFR